LCFLSAFEIFSSQTLNLLLYIAQWMVFCC